jgi:hypothetical protein
MVTALAYGMPASNNQGTSANPNALLAGVQNSSYTSDKLLSASDGAAVRARQ